MKPLSLFGSRFTRSLLASTSTVLGVGLSSTLSLSCAQMTAVTKSVDLPVAVDARVVIAPPFDHQALAAAGESGLFAELVGKVVDVAVRTVPDEWTIEVVAVDPHDILAGPPITSPSVAAVAADAAGAGIAAEGASPPEPPARWTITIGGVTGLVPPVDDGDAVWVRRSGWNDPGAPVTKESVSIGRVGDGVSLVFFDGSPAADWGMLLPASVRLRASSTLVYTTTGQDDQSCHRIIEHRAFAIPSQPSAILRPGESMSVVSDGVRWTVLPIDHAVTVESETCPGRRWDRFAWLAVRAVGLEPAVEPTAVEPTPVVPDAGEPAAGPLP